MPYNRHGCRHAVVLLRCFYHLNAGSILDGDFSFTCSCIFVCVRTAFLRKFRKYRRIKVKRCSRCHGLYRTERRITHCKRTANQTLIFSIHRRCKSRCNQKILVRKNFRDELEVVGTLCIKRSVILFFQ